MNLSALWQPLLLPLLNAHKSKHIVEIGAAKGLNTQNLVSFCIESDAKLDTIDTVTNQVLENLRNTNHNKSTFHNDYSFNALPKISGYDTVIIDGDHNWYTIFNELLIIEKDSRQIKNRPFPLVIIHDVGWPYGRRDLYYNPKVIPDSYRQTITQQGLLPNQGQPAEKGGFNKGFNHAFFEGNPKNGVLTAVEDFLEQSKEMLDLIIIPGFHGIGIICSRWEKESNIELSRFLESYEIRQPLAKHFEQLEYERVNQEILLFDSQEENELLKQDAAKRDENTRKILLELSDKEEVIHNLQILKEQKAIELSDKDKIIASLQKSLNEQIRKANELYKHARIRLKMLRSEIRMKQEELDKIDQDYREKENQLTEFQITLEKMQNSKSWRWTMPFRKFGSLVNQIIYSIIGFLHDIWTDFGKPCPILVRFIRHKLLKRWPPQELL
ncbi:MAG: class I SAM-dependent methyltransferase [Patescibacteria group bacterium]